MAPAPLVEVTVDSRLISEALVLWIGRHIKSWPQRDDQRVIDRYGQDAALDLLPVIHQLAKEFYESDARYLAVDLVQMGNQAEERFRGLHPELTEEAIGALGWCYTFDYK